MLRRPVRTTFTTLTLVAVLACPAGWPAATFAQAAARPRAPAEVVPLPEPAAEPARAPVITTDPVRARYLAIGGGSTPEYTEVSLEQDLALARDVLPGPGMLFFAGGAESASVRLINPRADAATLLARLGAVFAPRAGRESQYRATKLPAAAATLFNVESALTRALANGEGPLLVYVAAHGEQGEHARDNHVALWGGELLTVARIAELSEARGARSRPLRLLVASCFSGGFGELAFEAADPAKGPARAPRCGLFAGPWDRQTSGCDPNPDRGAQEGYSIHVLSALRGQDRHGKLLPRAAIDFDGDGKISLLEAHTRARIASSSIDVPTTTSERYLREVEHRHAGQGGSALLPEEGALIAQLGERLALPNRASAERRWKALGAQLDALDARIDEAEDALDRAQSRLAAELLGRWPVLDDPYHADFASVLQKNAPAIKAVLDASAGARDFVRIQAQADTLGTQLHELEPQEALVLRLLRAYETVSLAGALKARGGSAFGHYRALLDCERSAP